MDISDSFIDLISSGRTFGVYFVITGSTRNSIYYKATEHISTFFTLKMNDPGNYLDIHNVRPPVTPEDISGRGITVLNKEIVEFQTAVAFDTETEAERVAQIAQDYCAIAKNGMGMSRYGSECPQTKRMLPAERPQVPPTLCRCGAILRSLFRMKAET